MSISPRLEQLDPALLAFVKCHVTSPVKWEVLRVLASQNGAWLHPEELARSSHRQACELSSALADLAADGLVEVDVQPASAPQHASYRLPADEPTSVVLHRLIEATTQSQDLRAIIAAHLAHIRQQNSSHASASAGV